MLGCGDAGHVLRAGDGDKVKASPGWGKWGLLCEELKEERDMKEKKMVSLKLE